MQLGCHLRKSSKLGWRELPEGGPHARRNGSDE